MKVLIEKFGNAPGGKAYFQDFKDDLRKMQVEMIEIQ